MKTLRSWLLLAAVVVAALPAACANLTARSPEPTDEHPHPAGIAQIRWRTELHQHGLFEPTPEECATGALVGQGRQLVIGSRASAIVSVGTERGQIMWATSSSGGIDSTAFYDAKHNQVYVGADDGTFYALDPGTGTVRWSYHAKGAIEEAPDVGGDTVYFGTAADRVIALDASNGKWRWQYERETPEGFTIHGYSGPRTLGEDVIAGFSDGYLVSLNGGSGEVVWARSLAAASDQFVDVDSTPTIVGNTIYASSYSGGLYAVDAQGRRDSLARRNRRSQLGLRRRLAHLLRGAARGSARCGHRRPHPLAPGAHGRRAISRLRSSSARTWSSRAAARACSSSTARPASCSRSSTPAAASAPRPRSIRPAAASTSCRTAARSMRWT